MVIRYLALWFLLLIGTAASAQKEERSMGVFIRVYDLQGKKMAKGNLVAVSQEMLQIDHLDSLVTIAAVDIGKIKDASVLWWTYAKRLPYRLFHWVISYSW